MPHKDPGQARVYYAAHRIAHKEERATYNRAYRAAHREEMATYRAMHLEETATYRKSYNAVHKDKIAAYRSEHRAQMRAYREAHAEEIAAKEAVYRKAHPQETAEKVRRWKALKRGATVGIIDIAAIKARDKMLCAICERKVAEKDFSLDHTIPLSLGGPHSQENLRVAHYRCNSKRGAGRLPVQMVLC